MNRAAVSLVDELHALLSVEPLDVSRAALTIAKIEYPRLDPAVALSALRELGDRGARRVERIANAPVRLRIAEINQLLYDDEGFSGNRTHYGDFRNSLLNVVLERRLGIPISLALVYMEVARRSGLEVFGISFPGHFLMCVASDADREGDPAIILDPFDRGRELDEDNCRQLLMKHLGTEAEFRAGLLQPCTGRQFLARMLNNLKRTYVEQRSFPQALLVIELLLAIDPGFDGELRDRGLVAYHLDDFSTALRDLERYLRLHTWKDEDRDEHDRVRHHVRVLRQRAASLN